MLIFLPLTCPFTHVLATVSVLRDEFRLEPQNTRIAQGDTALLECAPPRGIPEPTVTWKKGGQKLDLEGSKRIRIVDGGNLAIQDARQTDEGQYQCIAKNPVGVRESSLATLKVHGESLTLFSQCGIKRPNKVKGFILNLFFIFHKLKIFGTK